jgi:hypothetical protein
MLVLSAAAFAGMEPPAVEWERAFGGPGRDEFGNPLDDWAYSVQLTSDGGYIIAGTCHLDDRVLGCAVIGNTHVASSDSDVYVIKTVSFRWACVADGFRPRDRLKAVQFASI